MKNAVTIQRLSNECSNIRDDIQALFKLSVNNYCPIESNNSLQTKSEVNQLDSLEIVYNSYLQMRNLLEEFEHKSNRLKSLKRAVVFKSQYGSNQCNLRDYYDDIVSIKKPKRKILVITNQKSCNLIEYYKSLPLNIRNHNIHTKFKQKTSPDRKHISNIKKNSYLYKYYKKVLLHKRKNKLKSVSKLSCDLNIYYKKLIFRVAKSADASKRIREYTAKNSCSIKQNFKKSEFFLSYFKSLKKKPRQVRPVSIKNQCDLINYYENLFRVTIKSVRPISKNLFEKSHLMDYYIGLAINSSKSSKNELLDELKLTKQIVVKSFFGNKKCNLKDYYKNILSIKKQKKKLEILFSNQSCHLIDFYINLAMNLTKPSKNIEKFNQLKSLKTTLVLITHNQCNLADFYKDILSIKKLSKQNSRLAFNFSRPIVLSKNKSKIVKQVEISCQLEEYYKNITSSIILKKASKLSKKKTTMGLNQSSLIGHYKILFSKISKKRNFAKLKVDTKKLFQYNVCFLNDYYSELLVNISERLSLKKLIINKAIKPTKVCDINDLVYYTFLQRIEIKIVNYSVKTPILYDKYVYLFNLKYLRCDSMRTLNKKRNLSAKLVKNECKECISYMNWLIQLAPNKTNRTLEKSNDSKIVLSDLSAKKNIELKIEIEKKAIETPIKHPEPAKCEGKFQIDCYDYYKQGYMKNTVLSIRPNLKSDCDKVKVSCDMKSNGFTLIMRRQFGQIDFKRNWTDYKSGFGDPSKDHWIGNDMLYYLTNQLNYSLRIELEDWDGNRKYANYEMFRVKSEFEGYELQVSGYSGDAGDSLSDHSGQKFSTLDVDNDDAPLWAWNGNCAARFGGGGWWYKACYKCNLNGKYYVKGRVPSKMNDGIAWKTWLPPNYSLKLVEMKIRRNFNKRF